MLRPVWALAAGLAWVGGQAGGVIGGSAGLSVPASAVALSGNGQIELRARVPLALVSALVSAARRASLAQISVSAGGGLGGVGNVSGLTGVSSNGGFNASGQAGLIASEGATLNSATMPHLSGD